MPRKKARVVQSNSVTSASYTLTLIEKQILLLAIAKLGELKTVTAETPFVIAASELQDVFGSDQSDSYKQLKEAVERLSERWVVIDKPDPEDPRTTRTRTRWVHAIDYQLGEGLLKFYFAPKILPYLSSISREFTQFHLKNAAKMTSVYAIRIYEILSQWKSRGELDIELEWLREKLELSDMYQDVRDLKKRVVQPAVDQINEHSDLWAKYTQKKQGRVIVAFSFLFGVKEIEAAKPRSSQEIRNLIDKNARPGETWDQARDRLLNEKSSHSRQWIEKNARPGETWDQARERLRREERKRK